MRLSTPIFFDRGGDCFVDQLIRLHDFFLRHRIDHRFAADATDDARREIDDFFVAFVDRTDDDAVDRAAIDLVDDHVLRRVDEFARQVTGIGRLKRGVGQTFAGTVGRDEILEHGQPFAEVRGDRPLDDFARRLGHQTAHAGELFHLLAIAARAGIDHEEDRVQFLAALVMLEGAEHDVGDFVAGVGPDVDDLVVALAIGDDAFAVLLLDLLDLLVGVRELELFLLRNDHVGDADGDAGLGRFREAEFLQAIERLDRALLAGHLIATPDNVAELLLAGGFVEETRVRPARFR